MIRNLLQLLLTITIVQLTATTTRVYSQSKQQLTINLTPLGDGYYIHTSYQLIDGAPFPSNGVVASTKVGVVLVDAAWGDDQTDQLLKWIQTNLKKKVVLAIITHSHADKIGGIRTLLSNGIRVVSTAQTAARAVKDGYPAPEAILPAGDTTFTIGSTKIQTYFPGEGHAPDNIVVWFPQKKLLAGGCLVKSTDTDNLGNLADANLADWPGTMRKLITKYADATFVIPGHQGWNGKPLEHTLKLLEKK